MSDKDLARRTEVEVFFDGANITDSLRQNLVSISYVDNENDEADDLQIQIEDKEDKWLVKWLDKLIKEAVKSGVARSSSKTSKDETYKVTARSGLRIRSGPGTKYKRLGLYAYGTQVKVHSISNNWAKITYSGKTAYLSANYLSKVSSGSSASGGSTGWAVGNEVIANGRPQYSSYGDGTPGKNVTNYKGKITYLNLKGGVPYPIHVGYLGWFSKDQIKAAGANEKEEKVSTIQGLNIQALFIRKNWNADGKDKILDCGQFELDSIDVAGPPNTINIKGTSLPYSNQIRQTKKNRAWEATYLSKIAKKIASQNSMTVLYESNNDPYYSRVQQAGISDIAFLTRLSKEAGISIKATNRMVILFDQAAYESRKEVLVIKKNSGSYIKYKLRTGDADKAYSSCRVSYTNPTTKKTIQGIAYAEDYNEKSKNNQTLEINAKVSSIGEAQNLAKKYLRLKNKYEYTGVITLYGNPDLLAGSTVKLDGWGTFDGKYIISQAKHSIGKTGYTTQIRIRHVLVEEVPAKKASGAPTQKEIKVGSKVRVKQGAKTYTGGGLASFVYTTVYDVQQIKGDRVVIGIKGQVTAAMKMKDLIPQ